MAFVESSILFFPLDGNPVGRGIIPPRKAGLYKKGKMRYLDFRRDDLSLLNQTKMAHFSGIWPDPVRSMEEETHETLLANHRHGSVDGFFH